MTFQCHHFPSFCIKLEKFVSVEVVVKFEIPKREIVSNVSAFLKSISLKISSFLIHEKRVSRLPKTYRHCTTAQKDHYLIPYVKPVPRNYPKLNVLIFEVNGKKDTTKLCLKLTCFLNGICAHDFFSNETFPSFQIFTSSVFYQTVQFNQIFHFQGFEHGFRKTFLEVAAKCGQYFVCISY